MLCRKLLVLFLQCRVVSDIAATLLMHNIAARTFSCSSETDTSKIASMISATLVCINDAGRMDLQEGYRYRGVTETVPKNELAATTLITLGLAASPYSAPDLHATTYVFSVFLSIAVTIEQQQQGTDK